MTHTHMQSVGKCNGKETLEMLPHSTRKCNKLLSRKLSPRPLKVYDTTDAIYRFVKGLYRIPKGSIAFQGEKEHDTQTRAARMVKCNGNETLEMLPHSTLQTRNSTEKTKFVPSCITSHFASSVNFTAL